MMLRRLKRGLLAAAAGVLALALPSAGPAKAQSGEPIKIGFSMSLTGPLSPNGKQALLGLFHGQPGGRMFRQILSEGAHRADAADTREDLLLDAVILVPAVETVRDAAQIRVVLGDVGIEQQQRHSSDLSDPHSRTQHPATGHGDVNDDRRSVFGSRACVRRGASKPRTWSAWAMVAGRCATMIRVMARLRRASAMAASSTWIWATRQARRASRQARTGSAPGAASRLVQAVR